LYVRVGGIFFWRRGKVVNLSKRKNVHDQTVQEVMSMCKDIDTLNMSNCYNLSEKSLAYVAEYVNPENFKVLLMNNCWKINDIALSHLNKLISLNRLDISSFVNFSTTTASILAKACTSLTHIKLAYTTVSDQDIEILCEIPQLEDISVRECKNLTDIGITTLIDKCTRIKYLNCRLCNITDKGLKSIARSKSLIGLDISACSAVTSKGFCKFIAKCQKLECLQAFACQFVDDSGLLEISKRNFISLDVSYALNITDTGIQYLANCSTLQHLDVFGCKKLVQLAASILSQRRTGVKVNSWKGENRKF